LKYTIMDLKVVSKRQLFSLIAPLVCSCWSTFRMDPPDSSASSCTNPLHYRGAFDGQGHQGTRGRVRASARRRGMMRQGRVWWSRSTSRTSCATGNSRSLSASETSTKKNRHTRGEENGGEKRGFKSRG